MIVATDYAEITVDQSPLRMFLAAPKTESKKKFPGIVFFSDIFQLTGPMIRTCVRLAGYGFVVAAPEIYHRIEPPGAVIAFDDPGRTRGLENASKTEVAEFDSDCRAVLDHLAQHDSVSPSKFRFALRFIPMCALRCAFTELAYTMAGWEGTPTLDRCSVPETSKASC